MAQPNDNNKPTPAPIPSLTPNPNAAPLPSNDTESKTDNRDTSNLPSAPEMQQPSTKKIKSHLNELKEDQKAASSINSNAYRSGGAIYNNQKLLEKHLNSHLDKPSEGWDAVESPFKTVGIKMLFGGSNLIQISRNEFIIALNAGDEIHENNPDQFGKDNGIWCYNIDTQKWTLLIEYPNNFFAQYHTICYDDQNQIVYLSNSASGIYKVSLITKKITPLGMSQSLTSVKWQTQKPSVGHVTFTGFLESGTGGKLFCIDGELQHFLGRRNNRHLRWNDDENLFDEVKKFDEFPEGLMGFGMVNNSRDKELLFMGGFKGQGRGRTDEIWRFSMDRKKSKDGSMLGWQKLENIKMPQEMQSFACVITSDCKNVLIFGGSVPDGMSENIQILNLETMKWRMSKIKIPYKTIADGCVILMRKNSDYLLIKGYLKECVEDIDINNWVIDLEEIVFDFYVNEEVHVVRGLQHAKIALVDILTE